LTAAATRHLIPSTGVTRRGGSRARGSRVHSGRKSVGGKQKTRATVIQGANEKY